MGIAQDESTKALDALARISRMPAVDPNAVKAIRRQLAGIENQIRGGGATTPPVSKGTSK